MFRLGIVHQVLSLLKSIDERLVRIETRLVVLAEALHVNVK